MRAAIRMQDVIGVGSMMTIDAAVVGTVAAVRRVVDQVPEVLVPRSDGSQNASSVSMRKCPQFIEHVTVIMYK